MQFQLDRESQLQDIHRTQFAKAVFDDILIGPITNMSAQVTQENINQTINTATLLINQRYSIDASLFSDIGFILINVLSNCIG